MKYKIEMYPIHPNSRYHGDSYSVWLWEHDGDDHRKFIRIGKIDQQDRRDIIGSLANWEAV